MQLDRFEASADGWDWLAARLPGAHRLLLRCSLFALSCSVVAVTGVLVMSTGSVAGWFGVSSAHALVAQAAVVVYLIWSLAVRVDRPGVPVGRTRAPALFDLIDRCCEELGAGPVEVVQISTEFDVRVVQVPALGPYGRSRTCLVLGLPALLALTPAQLECLVVHALAHHTGERGSLPARAYRLEALWLAYAATLSRRRPRSAWPFVTFLDWYLPRLRAMALPILRDLERDADLIATASAGSGPATSTLITAQLTARYVDERLTPIAYPKLREALPAPRAVLLEGLALELLVAADPYDPHPSISERLAAAGVEGAAIIREAPAPGETAAVALAWDILDEIGALLYREHPEATKPADEETADGPEHEMAAA
jgi:hypothetical protein